MDIEEYIESGILESFVLGAASEAETRELLYFKDKYPQIQMALQELELDMEHIAQQMAIAPPPHAWDRIEDRINEITVAPERDIIRFKEYDSRSNDDYDRRRENYIEVAESESTHIRVHKNWKWAFAAVFVLGKIFLACAIYFYLENRQAQERIQELKTELRQPAR